MKNLPLQFALDGSMAWSSAYPHTAPGDLQGMSATLKLGSGGLSIDNIVK